MELGTVRQSWRDLDMGIDGDVVEEVDAHSARFPCLAFVEPAIQSVPLTGLGVSDPLPVNTRSVA